MTEREALTIFRVIQKCRHQALHTNDCGNCERCQYYLEQEQIDGAVALAISALEKQEQARWIPVTERLPEEDDYKPCYGYDDGAVWWLNDIGMMGLGWYYTSTENWVFYNEITHVEEIVGNVIAWRPLPEAYQEEEA